MDIDDEVKLLMDWEKTKLLLEKIMSTCFCVSLFLGLASLIFKAAIHNWIIGCLIVFVGIGLKVFTAWWLIYGGIVSFLEKLQAFGILLGKMGVELWGIIIIILWLMLAALVWRYTT